MALVPPLNFVLSHFFILGSITLLAAVRLDRAVERFESSGGTTVLLWLACHSVVRFHLLPPLSHPSTGRAYASINV